ncbi:hypothetical protein ACTWPT_05005 [Nonomuraea sp. 3N208]|uniref:hypothetical protein n=1 Tax=Nonomuraea sp. 3N208 TaxID=3457421 RepID=UPI003FCD626D
MNTPFVEKAIPTAVQMRACQRPLPSRTYLMCEASAAISASCSGTALSAADHQLIAGTVSGAKT